MTPVIVPMSKQQESEKELTLADIEDRFGVTVLYPENLPKWAEKGYVRTPTSNDLDKLMSPLIEQLMFVKATYFWDAEIDPGCTVVIPTPELLLFNQEDWPTPKRVKANISFRKEQGPLQNLLPPGIMIINLRPRFKGCTIPESLIKKATRPQFIWAMYALELLGKEKVKGILSRLRGGLGPQADSNFLWSVHLTIQPESCH